MPLRLFWGTGPALIFLLLVPISSWAQSREQLLERATSLNKQVMELYNQGKYAQAIPLAKEVLTLREQALGPTHPAVAINLNNLADLRKTTGDHAGARPLYERALKINEQALGPSHPAVADTLNSLADLLQATGDYAAAKPLFERALKINAQALGPMHPTVAANLNNLAALFKNTGDYVAAKPLFERALKINEQVLGPTHPTVAVGLGNLADLLQTTGDYAGARPLYERALKISEQTLGSMHPDVAISLNNLAALLEDMGDYAGAKPLYERALRIREQALGPTHPDVATSLNNLAGLLKDMGDYAGARPLYERALKISEQTLGSMHPDVATRLNNLATLFQATGDYAGAKSLYERALKISEQALGPMHPDVATRLNNLATLRKDTGDYVGSKPLFERALKINEQVLGPTHPTVAVGLNNLADLLQDTGNSAAAKPLLERALKISEQALGPTHPAVATSLNNLALLAWDAGHAGEAASLLQRALHIVGQYTQHSLHGLAERQKLAFLRKTDGYIAHYLSLPSDVTPASAAYTVSLARKNLAFRVLSEERAAQAQTADPVAQELLAKRTRLSQTLAGLVSGAGGDLATRRQRVADVEGELEQVEAELSRASAAFQQEQTEARAGAAEVCRTLPAQTSLLDVVRYRRYTPRQGEQPGRWTSSYTIFVLRGGHCPEVQRFELGAAEPIDKAAKAFRESLTGTEGGQSPSSEAEVVAKAQALGALVLPPSVRAAIAGASMLLVAPDGPLALVPFTLLPGEDGRPFLLETRVVAMIPSGRDLLRLARGDGHRFAEPVPSVAPGIVLVGNPDYGATVSRADEAGAQSRATSRAGCGLEAAADFTPLPGTAEEVRAIAGRASASLKGSAIRQAEGRTATEGWLSQAISGQRYVHLATHGYFAGEGCAPSSTPTSRGVVIQAGLRDESSGPVGTNPLLLSGIALAGANRRTQAQSGADDGILTALEVTGLDLRGTDLVVLSACETGLGTQQTGQELLGLRWAFGMAGARTLLTSLWKVPDEPTVRLMTKFYGSLWQSAKDGEPLGKAAALRQAQLELIKDNRARFSGDSRPNDWGAWVLSGDWR